MTSALGFNRIIFDIKTYIFRFGVCVCKCWAFCSRWHKSGTLFGDSTTARREFASIHWLAPEFRAIRTFVQCSMYTSQVNLSISSVHISREHGQCPATLLHVARYPYTFTLTLYTFVRPYRRRRVELTYIWNYTLLTGTLHGSSSTSSNKQAAACRMRMC